MELRNRREEEIIYAAMNVFSKNGFEQSKMEDIAIEAGIGKGTIYGYFTSKRELFEEMICYNIDEYKEELSKILAVDNSFPEKLERLFRYHAKFIDQSLDIFHLINSGTIISESMKEKFIQEQRIFLGLIEDMIQGAMANGEIRKNIDPEIAALCIIGAINQLANKRTFMDEISVDSVDSKQLINIVMEGLVK